MSRSFRRVLTFAIGSLTAIAAGPGVASVQASNQQKGLEGINHIVVIYEENNSFDNLYGGWQGVNGRAGASAENTLQKAQDGTTTYTCLLQNDLNLLSPPLPAGCNFANQPFNIATYIPKDAATCPTPGGFFLHASLPDTVHNLQGGCTEDIVHRFYQEQYQLNNGAQNRYTTGSDAVGLTQGYYDTTALPIYQYLHSDGAPHYAIADDFFQAAFGGSFLNHQWLIAAASPPWSNMPDAHHPMLDSNGLPNAGYPLYTPTGPVADRAGTQACGLSTNNAHVACGNYAVNTIQPTSQPTSSNPLKLPPLTSATIGDRLTAAGGRRAWYSGGWG